MAKKNKPEFSLPERSAIANNLINFVDATPGLGKTEAAIRLMANHIMENRDGIILFVCPTNALLAKIKDERLLPMLRSAGARTPHLRNVHAIRGDDEQYKERVVFSVRQIIEGATTAGGNLHKAAVANGVVLITHAAFFRLPLALKNRDKVTVIFDEARKCVFEPIKVQLTDEELELFNKYLERGRAIGPSQYSPLRIKPGQEAQLKAKMEEWSKANKRRVSAAAYGRFRDMVEALELGTTEVYCKQSDGRAGSTKSSISFYEVHLPSKIFIGWKAVLIMSAYLRQTQLWALMCSDIFGLDGKVCRMKVVGKNRYSQGAYQAKPIGGRAHPTLDYELRDVTEELIPHFAKRRAAIYRSYKRATVVTLTGSEKDGPPSPSNLVSSTHLNSIFFSTEAKAEAARSDLTQLLDKHAEALRGAGVAGLRKIMMPDNPMALTEHLSDAARVIRDWYNAQDKASERPYFWYLDQGLRVCKLWFKKYGGMTPPLLLANVNHLKHMRLAGRAHDFKPLPHSCHGRDDFRDYTMILFQAAINPTPEARLFYDSQIPWYDYNQDHVVDSAIQAVTRTAIRDTESEERVLIVVPDPYLAYLISVRLDGLRIIYAQDVFKTPKVWPMTPTLPKARKAKWAKENRSKRGGQASVKEYNDLNKANPFFAPYNKALSARSRAKAKGDLAEVTRLTKEIDKLNPLRMHWHAAEKARRATESKVKK